MTAPGPFLSHFGVFALGDALRAADPAERWEVGREIRSALAGAAESVHFYGTFGTRPGSDAIAWSSVPAEDPGATRDFLRRYHEALAPFRGHLRLVDALWGFTRESEYARGAPDRGIDPFRSRTSPYLVVYPFAKSHAWYGVPSEERGRMMREHIRVGRAHEGIDQLLLYSTGLQDHEFVVVYETDDLAAFSRLVSALRATEARGYTLVDSPVHVGVHLGGGDDERRWP